MRTGGLVGWGHESECTHAVASSISGPYVKADEVLTPECHNPSTVRDPKSGEYLMFHIGTGGSSKQSSSFMHHASNPNGPWTPASTGTKCNNPGGKKLFICHKAHDLIYIQWIPYIHDQLPHFTPMGRSLLCATTYK